MVYLGDDHPIEILGKGNIRIKLDNGKQRMLCDVRHVPDLPNNFSLNQDDG